MISDIIIIIFDLCFLLFNKTTEYKLYSNIKYI